MNASAGACVITNTSASASTNVNIITNARANAWTLPFAEHIRFLHQHRIQSPIRVPARETPFKHANANKQRINRIKSTKYR